jgi:hypothetical protein
MCPPREEGWFAEDLDQLTGAPRHTELIDGTLVFRMFPQRSWHSRLRTALAWALDGQAPRGVEVVQGMTLRLDARNRPEADILVTSSPYDPDQTWFEPGDVVLHATVPFEIDIDLAKLMPGR